MLSKETLKNQIAEAQTDLRGLTVMELLLEKYAVRFRFLDPETGFHYYGVEKLGTNHRYTVKVKFLKFHTNLFVRSYFSFCPCARFSGEKYCHHLLLAIHCEAERSGYKEMFDLKKFAEFKLAKIYQQQIDKERLAI